jgi:hypothetical protein
MSKSGMAVARKYVELMISTFSSRTTATNCRRANQNQPVRVELKPATFSLQIWCAILRS